MGWRFRVEGAVLADVRRRHALRIGESGFAGEHNRGSVVDLSRWRVAVHPVHVENVDVTIYFGLNCRLNKVELQRRFLKPFKASRIKLFIFKKKKLFFTLVANKSFAGVRRRPRPVVASSGRRTGRAVPVAARVGYAISVLVHCWGSECSVLHSLGRFLAILEIFKLYITDLLMMELRYVLLKQLH